MTALTCQRIFEKAVKKFGAAPKGLCEVAIGAKEVGEALTDDKRVALVNSPVRRGWAREVAPGRGAFRPGAAGTRRQQRHDRVPLGRSRTGDPRRAVQRRRHRRQRCTSLRRLFVHEKIYDTLVPRLKKALRPGEDRQSLGRQEPDRPADRRDRLHQHAGRLELAQKEGNKVTGGERVKVEGCGGGFYVKPAVVGDAGAERRRQARDLRSHSLRHEIQEVPGCSRPAQRRAAGPLELHLHPGHARGGILPSRHKVRIAASPTSISALGRRDRQRPSAAKETGGGANPVPTPGAAAMRRATNTINYSDQLPLAQGSSLISGDTRR